MTLEDTKSLLIQVKSFYPRFDYVEKHGNEFFVNENIAVNWHRKIGWMDIKMAMALLDRWMDSEDGSKPPTISWWIRNGKAPEKQTPATMYFDRRNSACVWHPEPGGKVIEIPLHKDPLSDTYHDAEGRLYAIL